MIDGEKEIESFDRGSIEGRRVGWAVEDKDDDDGLSTRNEILFEKSFIVNVFHCLIACLIGPLLICDIRWPHMGLFPISGLI